MLIKIKTTIIVKLTIAAPTNAMTQKEKKINNNSKNTK